MSHTDDEIKPTGSSDSGVGVYHIEEKGMVKAPHHVYAEHGPLVDHIDPHPEEERLRPKLWWSRRRQYYKEAFSEFLGTFILILFGDGVVAQVVLSKGEKGSYQSISWGWG